MRMKERMRLCLQNSGRRFSAIFKAIFVVVISCRCYVLFFLSSCYCSLALSIPPLNNSTSDQFGIPTSFDREPLFRTKTNQTPITVRSWFGSSPRLIHIVPVCLHRKKKKKHFVFRQENKPPYNLTTHRGSNIAFKSFSYI